LSPDPLEADRLSGLSAGRRLGSARDHLRTATSELHERLHAAPLFQALGSERLDRAGYRGLLMRLWGFYYPVEMRLAERAHLCAELGLRVQDYARWPLLRADLTALGLPAEALDRVPISPWLPSSGSPGALLGILYVVEGSALGGRGIARGLDYLLGRDELEGRRFFAGDRPRSALWRACCAAIERHASTDERLSEICDAANDTFRLFDLWLNGTAPLETDRA